VGLERGPLSLVSTIEELLDRKSGGSGLESRNYGRRGTARWLRYTILSGQELRREAAVAKVRAVRSRTQATELLWSYAFRDSHNNISPKGQQPTDVCTGLMDIIPTNTSHGGVSVRLRFHGFVDWNGLSRNRVPGCRKVPSVGSSRAVSHERLCPANWAVSSYAWRIIANIDCHQLWSVKRIQLFVQIKTASLPGSL
jgi:hypothetical protein